MTLTLPIASLNFSGFQANIAQLVEQLIRNEQVVGSNPTVGSTIRSPGR